MQDTMKLKPEVHLLSFEKVRGFKWQLTLILLNCVGLERYHPPTGEHIAMGFGMGT